ncbi:MAG: AGE family epimerase/isomerase [Cyclobacteriaceae bacterium]
MKRILSKKTAEHVLTDNILDYWIKNMVDEKRGGFLGRIDGRENAHPLSNKAIILNTRILWTFSASYGVIKDENYKKVADRAYHYIVEHFVDTEQGGVYWMLDNKGSVVDSKKQIYAQAFAIYSLSEYCKINKDSKALSLAIELFQLIEEKSFDFERNGYFEALDRSWNRIEDVRLSEKDMNATKTMNTHLHIMEAYANLYRVWPNEKLKNQLKNLIELLQNKFLYQEGHYKLFFDDDWNLLSDEFSFGHDIEGAWLIRDAANAIGEAFLIEKIDEVAIQMTEAALEGLDEDGGLMNEGNHSSLMDTDKHWWPQAEALVGLIDAWEMTGKDEYLKLADKIWDFIQEHIIDPKGEWYWRVSRAGARNLSEDKAGPWKCPYHNGRAMIEMIKRHPEKIK